MSKRKVLVTGANGFVGRHCLNALVERGYDVHTVSSRGSSENMTGVSKHIIDLLNFSDVSKLMTDVSPSHLLHLAWYTEHGKFWNSPQNLDWLSASINLLQRFAENQGTRVVMVGTCAEYEWSDNDCSEEMTPLKPSSLYGVTKAALQSVLTSYTGQKGISSAWARLFFMYGPGEHPDKLAPSVIRSLIEGNRARCSHGMQLRDFMHVSDVALALVNLLDSSLAGAINIGSGNAVSIKTLVEEICVQMNKESFVDFGPIASNTDAPRIVADVSRLKNELRWEPTINLSDGLGSTIAWWQKRICDLNHKDGARGFAS